MVSALSLGKVIDTGLKSYLVKVFFILEFSLIGLVALLAWSTPETGYEISIYSSTPQIVWVLISSVMFASFGFAFYLLFYNKNNYSNYLKLCLVSVYLCYLLINSLFIFRGYYMWNISGDGATHLGWINELIVSGNIPTDLIYPFLHIFMAEIFHVTQLDLVTLHKLVPVIFGALFVPFMFILARYYFPKGHSGPYLVAFISCGFILPCTLLAPNMNSCLIFPFMLLIYVKVLNGGSFNYLILFFLVLIDVVIFHPITSFILGLIMFSMVISQFITARYKKSQNSGSLLNSHSNLLLILGVWYFSWFLQFQYFKWTVENMYNRLTEMAGAQYEVIGEAVGNASAVGNNPLIEIFQRYGQEIIILSLSLIGLAYLFYRNRFSEQYRPLRHIAVPFLVTISFMIAMVAAMGFNMATRYLAYIIILGVLFCAYLITNLFNRMTKKRNLFSLVAVIIATGLIFTAIAAGFLGVYPSTFNSKASYQTTHMSTSGMEWFFEHRRIDIPLTGITVAPGRYADLLLSQEERKIQNLPYYMYMEHKGGMIDDRRPPLHFGYTNSTSLGNYYDKETDLITNRQDIDYYSITRPELGSLYWQSEDFHRLLFDLKVDRIYSNGEYNMWKIYP